MILHLLPTHLSGGPEADPHAEDDGGNCNPVRYRHRDDVGHELPDSEGERRADLKRGQRDERCHTVVEEVIGAECKVGEMVAFAQEATHTRCQIFTGIQ